MAVRSPTTSCIIPTRNRGHLLPRALDSVRQQQLAVDEIIVVDDGSSDGTATMVRKSWPTVQLIRSSGVGPGRARHLGAVEARGQILLFLDSDDVWLPDHVARLMVCCDAGAQVAYGVTQNVDTIQGEIFSIPAEGEETNGWCFDALLRWCFLVPTSFAVSREAYEKVGGFGTGRLAEDWHLFLRLAARYRFSFCGPGAISRRYLHADSICRGCRKADLLEALTGLRHLSVDQPEKDQRIQQRFDQLLLWTKKRTKQWTTIQEWYLSLSRAGLL